MAGITLDDSIKMENEIEAKKLSQTTDFLPSDGASCSASSGPILRCDEKWRNGYYGSYKGNRVSVERDGKGDSWAFLISTPEGGILANGYTEGPMPMRLAILYAVKAAGLWPNVERTYGANQA